ncbi:MAG: fumarylacetoacetate hydrolase family protein [Bifidobacteriaceae bacterium]|jgi:2-keto-4-pentenoate hydratase/2-oxohepta-3-ene-1,7-dioic acid hydratase in catechol pathway|nr:fumarylacetoacetate hydrolase family protein [Bifidobacteriaceae bacterium]
MRIARFSAQDQDPQYGVVQGEEGEEVVHAVGGDPLYTEITPTGRTYKLEDVRLLAPVIPRSKVIGVAYNYRDPARAQQEAQAQDQTPVWFIKPNTSVCGPWDPIVLTADAAYPAFQEAELAVVVSRLAKHVPADQASQFILGYTVANDVGYRYPPAVDPRGFFGKGRDTFTPLGPWIETDLEPAAGLAVCAWVDGEPRQTGTTADLVTGVHELVAIASQVTTLLPGDVILTGTPAGASAIEPGQRVTCEVQGVGTLTNPVVRR